MQTFKDSKGREWTLSITVETVKRIRDLTNCNILDEKAIESLSNDIILLVDVLYAAIKPQADKDGISDEQFGAGLGGESLDAASEAFMEEYVNFFPKSRREMLKVAMGKQKEMEAKYKDQIAEKIGAEMEKAFSNIALNMPEQ